MSSPGPHFDLVTAGHEFLLAALPLRHPDSTRALRTFVDTMQQRRGPQPVIEAVLLRVLAILQRHAGQTLPSLVDRYLTLESEVPAPVDRFERCVTDAIARRAPRSPAARRVMDYIDAHFADPELAPRAVGSALGLSPGQLLALFTNDIGVHFSEYVKHARLDAAARRLAETSDTIKEVWAGVGYSHASDFDHHFKARFGLTPTEFRKRLDTNAAAANTSEGRADGDPTPQSARRRPDTALPAAQTVLIVDDAVGTRDTMRWYFKSKGYNALSAETAETALDTAGTAAPGVIFRLSASADGRPRVPAASARGGSPCCRDPLHG